jgi:proline dehydrogenase
MPGEDVASALAAAEQLRATGITTVLTHLGENVSDLTEAQEVTQHYIDVLRQIEHRTLPCHLSIKPTQLGLDIRREAAEENLCRIAAQAAELNNFVWVDMEGSTYVDPTLDIFKRVSARYPIVGLCVQSYLHRTASDLRALASQSPIIRLVKGAYREPPTMAFPKKTEVDEQFFLLAKHLLKTGWSHNSVVPGIATHDARLIQRIRDFATANGIPMEGYEFQMLYGIRREEQRQLVQAGHRMRVLISYGSAWFPWYMRRLAERPANLWFVVKSLVG